LSPTRCFLILGYRFGGQSGSGETPVRADVENVGDNAPPIFPTWQQANTEPSLYDVLGRRYYLRLLFKFR